MRGRLLCGRAVVQCIAPRVAHNGGVTGPLIFRIVTCLAFALAVLPSLAQSVTAISNSQMLFSDPEFGVSFRFPSGWSFTRVEPNRSGSSLAIASIEIDGRSENAGLRGLVTNETLPGIHSWPKTIFSSVEFGYDARRVASAEACQKLARAGWDQEADSATINDVKYWHGTAQNCGTGTCAEEDMYATYVEAGGACLRFDLAMDTCSAPGRDRPRELTAHELELIHLSLKNILSSVRVAPPAQ